MFGASYVVAIDAAYTGGSFAVVIGRREGERGVTPIRKPWRNALKVDGVTALRQLFYAGHISLPRHPALLGTELVQLETAAAALGPGAHRRPHRGA